MTARFLYAAGTRRRGSPGKWYPLWIGPHGPHSTTNPAKPALMVKALSRAQAYCIAVDWWKNGGAR